MIITAYVIMPLMFFIFSPRLSGELMYQQMPYSVKIISGKLYQSYGSLLLVPSYKVLSWLTVEGGLGIALNIKDYMVFVKD